MTSDAKSFTFFVTALAIVILFVTTAIYRYNVNEDKLEAQLFSTAIENNIDPLRLRIALNSGTPIDKIIITLLTDKLDIIQAEVEEMK